MMWKKIGWQVNEEVNRDKTGEADGMNMETDSKDEVMHIWMSVLPLSIRRRLVGEKRRQQMRSGYCKGAEERSGCEDS